MPFVSKAQTRWGHSDAGKKALGGGKAVDEWQSETPANLPERKGSLADTAKNRGASGGPKTSGVLGKKFKKT